MAGMIWNAIVDHIPLWGWLIIFGLPAAAALYYASPILIPLWRMLPTPVKAILIGISGAVLAYLGGRYKGRADAEEQDRRRNAEALQKRTEVDRDVDKLSRSDAEKKLRDRWGRDP
jgi:membrane protein implicated in regulation of membrane protease activity